MPVQCAICTHCDDALSHIPDCEIILLVRFFAVFSNYTIHSTANVSEDVNRKLPARNTTVQLLTIYTDPECYNAQHYRRTDRRTDDVIMMPRADYTAIQLKPVPGLSHARTDHVPNTGPSSLVIPFETAGQTPQCPGENTKCTCS